MMVVRGGEVSTIAKSTRGHDLDDTLLSRSCVSQLAHGSFHCTGTSDDSRRLSCDSHTSTAIKEPLSFSRYTNAFDMVDIDWLIRAKGITSSVQYARRSMSTPTSHIGHNVAVYCGGTRLLPFHVASFFPASAFKFDVAMPLTWQRKAKKREPAACERAALRRLKRPLRRETSRQSFR